MNAFFHAPPLRRMRIFHFSEKQAFSLPMLLVGRRDRNNTLFARESGQTYTRWYDRSLFFFTRFLSLFSRSYSVKETNNILFFIKGQWITLNSTLWMCGALSYLAELSNALFLLLIFIWNLSMGNLLDGRIWKGFSRFRSWILWNQVFNNPVLAPHVSNHIFRLQHLYTTTNLYFISIKCCSE